MRAVELRSDVPVDGRELRRLIALVPGQPLDEARVRQTLARLRLSGLVAEVEVRSRPAPGGVVAIVVLRGDLQVESVEVLGDPVLGREGALAVLPQRPGQPLREDRVLRGVYRLEEALAAQGYLDAQVTLAVAIDEPTRRARLAYRVAAGERWRVGAIDFQGLPAADARIGPEKARAALRARSGEPFRAATVRDDPDRLQRFLFDAGYRSATVEALPEARDEAARKVDLAYAVELGPRFELELVGADRKTLEKRGLLPFLGEAGYDEALLLQSVARIRSFFQEKGHYRVEVRTAERREGDQLRLRLEVVPGPRLSLEEVAFEGNATFAPERLARLMTTAPRRLLAPGSGRLVDEELQADLSNLRSFYALQGFGAARIGPARVATEGDRLRLLVPIEEGARRRVGTLTWSGVTALDPAALERTLPLAVGGPFHRLLVEQSVEVVSAAYERAGYRSALVSATIDWSADDALAAVTLSVLEGERTLVGAVVLRGNRRTASEVVRRFVDLEPGDPVSTEKLLEVERTLYKLGLFSRVDVAAAAAAGAVGPGEVLVEVEEGRTGSVAYGAGYDSEIGARGLLRLAETNLFGRALAVRFDALAGQREQIYRLIFQQPYVGPLTAVLQGSVYREFENRPDFETLRRGTQIAIAREVGGLDLRLIADYRIVETEIFDPQVVLPRESTDARVASLTPALFVDRRDDPIDPRRGWSLGFQVERATPLLDADAEFRKLFAQGTLLVPLGAAGVVAASLRGGALENLRDDPDPSRQEGVALVPFAERFFAGGRASHRAFERDELGIPGETLFVRGRDDVTPLGGGALALANLEWRFPIVGAFGGTVFVDAGNVWIEPGDVDPGELRWGAGVGLRYLSPIGPIRVEIGWKLDREPFESSHVWFVSLGNPF